MTKYKNKLKRNCTLLKQIIFLVIALFKKDKKIKKIFLTIFDHKNFFPKDDLNKEFMEFFISNNSNLYKNKVFYNLWSYHLYPPKKLCKSLYYS